MYNVLMFSPAFAPFANAEAIVNNKLVLAMLNAGWSVDVISRNLRGISSYDYGSDWCEPWTVLENVVHEISYEKGNSIQKISDTVVSCARTGHFIEGCRWARKAYEKAMLLHVEKQFDIVLSRAMPVSAHLPAMQFAREIRVPWIANWNDPWEYLRNKDAHGSLIANIGLRSSLFCRRVSRNASWNTFPSERLRTKMMGLMEGDIGRSSVIPHAALPLSKHDSTIQPSGDTFRICYLGRVSQRQDIKVFLEGLAQFQKGKADIDSLFSFIGLDETGIERMAADLGIERNVKKLGSYQYPDAVKYIMESDLLLVVDPQDADGVILSSKISDYVFSGKPILAVTNSVSESRGIIETFGGGMAVGYSAQEVAQALERMFSLKQEGTLASSYGSARLYAYFSPEQIIRSYEELFKRLTS